jgi:hypothetical protein
LPRNCLVTQMSPPVTLVSYRLQKLSLEIPPKDSPGDGQVVVECFTARAADNPLLALLRLKISTTPPAVPAPTVIPLVEAVIEGHFYFAAEVPEQDREQALRTLGSAQLYSLLRGMVSGQASLFSITQPPLPTLNLTLLTKARAKLESAFISKPRVKLIKKK